MTNDSSGKQRTLASSTPQTDRQMDRQTDRQIHRHGEELLSLSYPS